RGSSRRHGGAGDARLSTCPWDHTVTVGVVARSVRDELRGGALLRPLPGRPATTLLRRHRAGQGGTARPWLPQLLRTVGRATLPARRSARGRRVGATRTPRGPRAHTLAVPRQCAHRL